MTLEVMQLMKMGKVKYLEYFSKKRNSCIVVLIFSIALRKGCQDSLT